MDQTPELILHKPTATIQIGAQFSLVEQKLLNTLIYHSQTAHGQSISGEEQTISLSRIYSAINWTDTNNISDLKKAVRALVQTTIEWNEFKKDRAQEWTVCTFLASGTISRGKLRYILNPKIVQQVNRPVLFAKMQLLVQGRFAKRYSLILYEFMLDEISRSRKTHLVVSGVKLSYLIKLLGLENSYYSEDGQYKFFNQKILKPCLAEINRHSDLDVKVVANRQGRRVDNLDFEIIRKVNVQLSLGLGDDGPVLTAPDNLNDLIAELVSQGVAMKSAHALTKKYSKEQLRRNIDYFLEKLAAGKDIPNRGGYLVAAIKGDYSEQESPAEKNEQINRQQSKKASLNKEKSIQKKKDLEEEFQRFRSEQVRARFSERSKQFQTRRKNLFAKRIESGDLPAGRSWKSLGFDSPAVSATFFGELMPELLIEAHETNFEDYCQWRGAQP